MIVFIVFINYLFHTVHNNELEKKASFIANIVFDHRLSTSVMWWHGDPIIVSNFLKNYHGSVKTVKIIGSSTANNSEFNVDIGYKQTVFFASHPGEYKYFLENINKTIMYPLRLILVVLEPTKGSFVLKNYTKLSLDNSVTDIVIVSSDNENNVTLSTYMPIGPDGCDDYSPVILQSEDSNLFPQKYTNFYGCPLKVIIVNTYPYAMPADNITDDVKGMDIEIFDLLIEQINATMLKTLERNMSGLRAFRFVRNGTYDMCLPSIIISHNRYRETQLSHIFKTLDLVLCVPNQREIYEWAKVLIPFFTSITPLIVLSFLLFVGSIALAQRYGKFRKNTPKGIIFGTLGLFLGQGVKFETKYWLNNGLFMLWIWYCTVVRIAYQGDLVEGLQKTFLEPHIETVAQALDVVDEVGGPEGLLPNIKNTTEIKNKLVLMLWPEIPKYIEEISKGRNFMLITDSVLIRRSPYKVQVIDERARSIPQVYLFRPRWSGVQEIDRRLIQMFEAGFIAEIVRGYRLNPPIDTSDEIEPLTMTTVASCFIGLVILNLLWCVVLCIEIVWYKYVEKKKLL